MAGALPRRGPYVKGLDKKAQKLFNQRYLDLFKIVERHKDVISRVNVFSNPPANLGCFGWKSAVNFLFCIDFFFIVNTLSVFCSYRTIFVL